MPVPRESMRLEGNPDSPRLVTTRTKIDKTGQMTAWAGKRVADLEKERLSGFIFKSGSPSSGMERVKVYDGKGMPSRKGSGIFAREFMKHFPLLPVEDDGRLKDPALRENFIERVFALARWRRVLGGKKNLGSRRIPHRAQASHPFPQHKSLQGDGKTGCSFQGNPS